MTERAEDVIEQLAKEQRWDDALEAARQLVDEHYEEHYRTWASSCHTCSSTQSS